MKRLILPLILSVLLIISLSILRVLQDLNLTLGQTSQIYQSVKNLAPPPSPYNFIILGLDPRDDQLEKSQTTDTVIFASLNSSKNQLKLISLPRDLWWTKTQTKINQIYPQLYDGTSKSLDLIKDEFSAITGQPQNDIFIITTQSLSQLIAIIGGVDVNLETGFTDSRYPNPAYIASPSAQIPVYITISFPSGLNHIDNTNISQFVRSRKSSDSPLEGGTDIGRIVRQQLVIDSLIKKIQSDHRIFNYANFIAIYHWWPKQNTTISFSKLIKYGLNYRNLMGNLTVEKVNLPLAELDNLNGVIYHPNYLVAKQWVYLPTTPDYQGLLKFIATQVN